MRGRTHCQIRFNAVLHLHAFESIRGTSSTAIRTNSWICISSRLRLDDLLDCFCSSYSNTSRRSSPRVQDCVFDREHFIPRRLVMLDASFAKHEWISRSKALCCGLFYSVICIVQQRWKVVQCLRAYLCLNNGNQTAFSLPG